MPADKVSGTDIPEIRVVDWDDDPLIVVRYVKGENELDLLTVYAKVKRLTHHPGRGRIEARLEAGRHNLKVKECDTKFTDSFWECAANLLDYFADFFDKDTASMQNVWFHLLDVLQDAGNLPHAFWESRLPKCSHAQEFTQFYEQTLEIMNKVITKKGYRSASALIHKNDSLPNTVGGRLGGFKAGLTTWQQFLYAGSPGFNVPLVKRGNTDLNAALSSTDLQRFVPSGALAIIQTHTKRARDLLVNSSEDPDVLAEFDRSCINLSKEPFTTTLPDQRERVVQPIFTVSASLRAPRKRPGLADPSRMLNRPDLNLLDEFIGSVKGLQAFEGPGNENEFQTWCVSNKGHPPT